MKPARIITPQERAKIKDALGFHPDSARILSVSVNFNIPVSYACAISEGKPTQ